MIVTTRGAPGWSKIDHSAKFFIAHQNAVGVGVAPVPRGNPSPDHIEHDLFLADALTITATGVGGHGPDAHQAFGKLVGVPHAAVDHQARPAVFNGQGAQVTAHQGAAITATTIDHQNPALTWCFQNLADQDVVFKALQRGDGPGHRGLAAVVLKDRGQDPKTTRLEQILVGITQVGGGCGQGKFRGLGRLSREFRFVHSGHKTTSPPRSCKNPAMTTILSVFLAALILAYVLEPIAEGLHRLGLPRKLSALTAVAAGLAAALGLVVLLINILQREIPLIKDQAPKWIGDVQTWAAPQLERLHVQLDWNQLKEQLVNKVTQHFSANADTMVSNVIDTVLTSTQTLIAAIGALVLILFVVFYLLIDWGKFFSRAAEFVPPRYRDTVKNLAKECDELLSQYLRGQLVVMLILAAYYALALSMIGMAGGVAIGILTGLAIFIPYIGFGVGLVLAVISALLQFGPSWALLGVLAVYGVGQLVESFFLTPKLVGERIGLHPVAVIFALLFFGSLFGFFGVLLALPAAAIVLVTLRYIRNHYEDSDWFNK